MSIWRSSSPPRPSLARALALCCLLTALLSACNGADNVPASSSSSGAGGQQPEPLSWAPCPWFTVPPPAGVPAVAEASCANLDVPLQRDAPDGTTISIHLKRLGPLSGEPRGQLWLLDGGPGGEGISMERYAARWREQLPDFEFFVPHHRGVGLATRLNCAGEDPLSPGGFAMTVEEHSACGKQLQAQWGEGLRGFSPSEAALDLADSIARSQAGRTTPLPVTVYGGSYGTYLALRLAALAPAAASSIVLDSTCAPGLCWSAERDVMFDATAKTIFERCLDDAVCGQRLGPDPWGKVAEVSEGLAADLCPGLSQIGLDRTALRRLLGQLLNTTQARAAMAPLIARIERCSQDDIAAVVHLFNFIFGGPASPAASHFGQALYANIIASELYAPAEPDIAAIVDAAEATLASRGTTLFATTLYQQWPRYQPEATLSTLPPSVTVPLLVFHGGLDPLTPPATVDALRAAYPAANHVVFDDLGHGLVSLSLNPDDLSAPSCASRLVAAFASDPSAPLDTSCREQTFQLEFSASTEQAQLYFGRDDLWD